MTDENRESNLDSTNTLGFGIREATGFVQAQADADSVSEEQVNAVGTGMAEQAKELTDVDMSATNEMQGNSGTWQSDNPAGTGAGIDTGAGDGGWERDNDANQMDVNTAGVQPLNPPDASEGGSYAYSDGEDRTPPEE